MRTAPRRQPWRIDGRPRARGACGDTKHTGPWRLLFSHEARVSVRRLASGLSSHGGCAPLRVRTGTLSVVPGHRLASTSSPRPARRFRSGSTPPPFPVWFAGQPGAWTTHDSTRRSCPRRIVDGDRWLHRPAAGRGRSVASAPVGRGHGRGGRDARVRSREPYGGAMTPTGPLIASRVLVMGSVAGSGFERFVDGLASELGLSGRVGQGLRGVEIHVEGGAPLLGVPRPAAPRGAAGGEDHRDPGRSLRAGRHARVHERLSGDRVRRAAGAPSGHGGLRRLRSGARRSRVPTVPLPLHPLRRMRSAPRGRDSRLGAGGHAPRLRSL